VKTIEQGIEILTGIRAGKKLPDGTFERDTVNWKVDESLKGMGERLKEFPEFVVERRRG